MGTAHPTVLPCRSTWPATTRGCWPSTPWTSWGDIRDNKLRYVPTTDDPMELDHIAAQVMQMCNTCLLVSESEIYLPVNKPLSPNMLKLVTRGRHFNCGLIVDTRRIANLNKTVFSLVDHVFLFRMFSPTDLKYLEGFLPDISGPGWPTTSSCTTTRA